ncbi:MAG: hypothetical protein N2745_00495 [Syntrophorhabdaceae bacterium]|nr:hypothetical protein [Syntrophorhabdaceae bacterium]
MDKVIDELFLTSQALGELFDRRPDVIRRWAYECNARRLGKEVKKEDSPKVKYYLPDLLKHYLATYYKPPVEDEKQIKIQIETVKLEKEKFLLRKLKEEVYEKEEVELEWAQRLSEVKQALIALQFYLPQDLSGKELSTAEVKEIVKKYTNEIMERFSREGKYTHVDSKRKKGHSPARAKNGKRMG